MPWTVAKSPAAGKVLLAESGAELAGFQEVTFEGIDAPSSLTPDEEEMAQRLQGAPGFFQLNGDVPHELNAAFDGGRKLVLALDVRGVHFEVGAERRADLARVLLHESGIIGTQFPFQVTGPVNVTAAQDG